GRFRALLRSVRQYFRAVFGTVAALKKARREGGAAEFDALIAKITGVEQIEHDAALADEIEKLAGAATFSLSPFMPEDNRAAQPSSGQPSQSGQEKVVLYRAADNPEAESGAHFSEREEDARAYMDNPGFGGANLYRFEVD